MRGEDYFLLTYTGRLLSAAKPAAGADHSASSLP